MIQNMAMRTKLVAGIQTSSAAVEVALGRPPLSLRRKQLIYNYWLQISQNVKHPAYPAISDHRSDWVECR